MISRTLALSVALVGVASAAAAQASPMRIRGTVTAVSGSTMHVMPNAGGDDAITLVPAARITLVSPTTLAAVQPGSFIGTAATTQADGTLVAVEVHVFPESMRGAGEGHRPFDLGPKSTMTNGTVGQEVAARPGRPSPSATRAGKRLSSCRRPRRW